VSIFFKLFCAVPFFDNFSRKKIGCVDSVFFAENTFAVGPNLCIQIVAVPRVA
jgi:hypothetical protein